MTKSIHHIIHQSFAFIIDNLKSNAVNGNSLWYQYSLQVIFGKLD